ncbi:MAG: hypothetical protein ACQ9MH_16655 [Nitrospinales bacterium]
MKNFFQLKKIPLIHLSSSFNSTGGIKQSLDTLSKLDLIEKGKKSGSWSIVVPVFRKWLA